MIIHTQQENGFTLIEAMIVILLISILTAIAVPSWRSVMTNNNINAAQKPLRSSLQLARSEAISRRSPIFVTAAAGGFADGWVISSLAATTFANCNVGSPAAALECISVAKPLPGLSIASTQAQIRFNANGQASANTFTICDEANSSDIDGLQLSLSSSAVINTSSRACGS
ncbi:type IV fimbrial biogenesis protein FimT/type IV fimbrial biogenesis protein FimU [Sinobacterium caligoides]|uniref:Type II secretion system protein H n=1 Tax=Sinobacterium caligoides TaxID=933926 RepID=A0A3N2DKM0_9GAMM|nr:GspH/FimT family pseudopilin [Sinobacterium caligoides]ROS00336.1 type IV fimbrial biogenesis protein FimT/type IV fimbrial biogenesis protein FimU [Sinobacterium caligoides]